MYPLYWGIISGVLSESKKKVALYPNGLLLVLCVCIMFPGDVRNDEIFATGVPSPCVVLGEWSEEKVHSWDAWNSEKYVNVDEVITTALGQGTTEITEKIFGRTFLPLERMRPKILRYPH